MIGSTASLTWVPADTIDFSGEGLYRVKLALSVSDPQGSVGTDFMVLEFLVIN